MLYDSASRALVVLDARFKSTINIYVNTYSKVHHSCVSSDNKVYNHALCFILGVHKF